jgi:hypothetical protein
MNRSATYPVTKPARTDAQPIAICHAPPAILAALDMTVENERKIAEIIARTHSGDSPSWRMLAVSRVGDLLYELAERVDMAAENPERYDVVTWELGIPGKIGMRFQKTKHTHRAALRLYETLTGKTAPISPI